MNDAVLAALITGAAAIIANIITSNKASREMDAKLERNQAVTDTKLENLAREVNKHNNVIERTYRLEGQMNEVQHDIRDLKAYHKPTHNE